MSEPSRPCVLANKYGPATDDLTCESIHRFVRRRQSRALLIDGNVCGGRQRHRRRLLMLCSRRKVSGGGVNCHALMWFKNIIGQTFTDVLVRWLFYLDQNCGGSAVVRPAR